jgi:outer membrane lipoprotein-sorting protein
VVETLNGQQTWALQVSSVTFNTGLSDTDFQF